MLSTAIYPAFSPTPGRLRPRDRHRRAARPPRLRRASRSPTRSTRVAVRAFGGPAKAGVGGGPGRHRPAALHRPRRRRARRWRALVREAARRRARPRRVRGLGPAGARPAPPSWRRASAGQVVPEASSRTASGRRRGRRRGRRPWPRTSPCRPRRRPTSKLVRGSSPNIATPTLAVIGVDARPRRARARGSRSRSPRPTALRLARAAARQDDRELVAAEPGQRRRSRGCGRRSTSAISSITRSPAGWPSVSLTCLKWSRSSISSAPVRAVAAAARHRRPQVLLEAAPVLQPGQRVLARLALQLLHPLVAAPDQDQGAEQRRQRDPDHGQQQRQADVRAGRGRGRPAARCGRRSGSARWRRRRARPAVADHACSRSIRSCTSTSSGSGGIAAAARSATWKAPAAKPIRAARRCGHGRGRGAVAVDRPEDVDAGAADQQLHRRRRRPACRVSRARRRKGAALGVGAEVVAERGCAAELARRA